jgi:chemotaxis protein MotA
MDLATPLGIFLGCGFILAAITMHGSLKDFVDVPGAMVAFGGSTSALFIMFPIKKVMGTFGVVKNVFMNSLPNPRDVIKRIGELAGFMRREGLLALEKQIPDIKDPFMVRGLEMVVDGTPRDKLETVLQTELQFIQERHATGKKIFDFLGASLPAFGMVGTLIGLIQMLGALDDPSKIGAGMAVAMVTTFYGAFVANMFYLPMAGKLETRSKEETLIREMTIQGLLALVDGESPKVIETRLLAFLSPKSRLQSAA